MSAKPSGHAIRAGRPAIPAAHPAVRTNALAPLGNVPFHSDLEAITRRCPGAFPVHVAVHEISDLPSPPAPYTQPHRHPVPELNLLIAPPGALVYQLTLDGEVQEVVSPASIWIPAGVLHAANAIAGSGTFVCVLFASTDEAFPDLEG